MKISIVTISFNQARFLQDCIDSVARQEGPFEHIIVDPGSTDGSRDVIAANHSHFSRCVLEPDKGPADGLNNGFRHATGEIYYYLNADDVLFAGAFTEARAFLRANPAIDVVSGNGYIIDEAGRRGRQVWSDRVTRHGLAHGGSILIQPATFIRREAFLRTNGFNPDNRSSWDGELVVDLFLTGSRFGRVERYWAGFRLHGDSITGSARLEEQMRHWAFRRHKRVLGRPPGWGYPAIARYYRVRRVALRPAAIMERLRHGAVFGARRK